jgi:hypothetical protein
MKLHEEFKEYEKLWESTEAVGTTSLMWMLPDGTELDLNDAKAIQAEVNKVIAKEDELKTQGELEYSYSKLDAYDLSVMLPDLRDTLNFINKEVLDSDKTTTMIINKLKKHTDLATKVDLEDIRRQLLAGAKGVENKRAQRRVENIKELIETIYKRVGLIN